jgi:hypothetical protein
MSGGLEWDPQSPIGRERVNGLRGCTEEREGKRTSRAIPPDLILVLTSLVLGVFLGTRKEKVNAEV